MPRRVTEDEARLVEIELAEADEEENLRRIREAYALGTLSIEQLEASIVHVLKGGEVGVDGLPWASIWGGSSFRRPTMQVIKT